MIKSVASVLLVLASLLVSCTKSQKENLTATLSGDGSVLLALDFGQLPLSGSSEKTLTFTNPSTSPMTDLKLTMSDVRLQFKGGEYPGTGGTCSTALAPNASCTVVVVYTAALVAAAPFRGVSGQNEVSMQIRIDFLVDGAPKFNVIGTRVTLSFNNPPVAQDLRFQLKEDTATAVTLKASDPDGNALSYELVSNPAHGTLSGTAPNLTFTPAENFNGVDSFTYKANDGKLDSNIAVVNLTYSAVNDAPVANNASLAVTEDVAQSGTLTGSDTEGEAIAFSIVAGGAKGTAVITNSATGEFIYTPEPNASGTDTFTFRVSDGSLTSSPATVTVTIAAVNDAPAAVNGTLSATEDTVANGVLAGADPEASPLTYSIVSNGAKGNAVITNATSGTFSYTPTSNATGADSFTFKVTDGTLMSSPGTITVTIIAVNDAPAAVNGTLAVTEDVAKSGTLVGTDVEGSPLTYSIVNAGSKGSAVITDAATGAYTYTPNSNANGTDSFTFKVNDGTLDSNVATISVSIAPVSDAPVASDGSLAVTEDTAKTGTLVGSSPDSVPVTFSLVSNGTKGNAAITNAATGAFRYTPSLNATGVDSFTFKVMSGNLSSNTATVSVTIDPINDPPVASDGTLAVTEDISKTGTLAATDPDGDGLTFSISSNGSKGNAVITNPATGAYTYTPATNANGIDSISFLVSDGTINSNVATIIVTIAAVNDAPTANNLGIDVSEGQQAQGTLTATDPDSSTLTYSLSTPPTKGRVLSLNSQTGAFVYQAFAGSSGVDTFKFKAADGSATSEAATATMSITRVPASLEISEGLSFDFLTVKTGAVYKKSFRLRNTAAFVRANNISFSGFDGPFSFAGGQFPGTGGNCTETLAGGDSCVFTVQFAPMGTAQSTSTIEVSYSDSIGPKHINLSLLGRANSAGCGNTVFGNGGYKYFEPNHSFWQLHKPNFLSDGSFLALRFERGLGSVDLVKYTCGGEIDASFGNDGFVELQPMGQNNNSNYFHLTDPDGNSFVYRVSQSGDQYTAQHLIQKIDPQGNSVTVVTPPVGFGCLNARYCDLTLLSNGTVLLNRGDRLEGLNFDGTVNTNFGTGGAVSLDAYLPAGFMINMTQFKNEKRYIFLDYRSSATERVLRQFTLNGQPVEGFGVGGKKTFDLNDSDPLSWKDRRVAYNVFDGNFYDGSIHYHKAELIKIDGNLRVVPSFGTDGRLSLDLPPLGQNSNYSLADLVFTEPNTVTILETGLGMARINLASQTLEGGFGFRADPITYQWFHVFDDGKLYLQATYAGIKLDRYGVPDAGSNLLSAFSAPAPTWSKVYFADNGYRGTCNGNRYIKYNSQYQLWMGLSACSASTYKIFLSSDQTGTYREVADSAGWGQDHCELVNASFSLPNEDNITSGGCTTCALGGSPFAVPVSSPYFVRAKFGTPFVSESSGGGAFTPEWYRCGFTIPGEP